MCGISGIIGWPGGFDDGLLTIKKMTNSLHHRGPDDNGIWGKKIKFIWGIIDYYFRSIMSGEQTMISCVTGMSLLLMENLQSFVDQGSIQKK